MRLISDREMMAVAGGFDGISPDIVEGTGDAWGRGGIDTGQLDSWCREPSSSSGGNTGSTSSSNWVSEAATGVMTAISDCANGGQAGAILGGGAGAGVATIGAVAGATIGGAAGCVIGAGIGLIRDLGK